MTLSLADTKKALEKLAQEQDALIKQALHDQKKPKPAQTPMEQNFEAFNKTKNPQKYVHPDHRVLITNHLTIGDLTKTLNVKQTQLKMVDVVDAKKNKLQMALVTPEQWYDILMKKYRTGTMVSVWKDKEEMLVFPLTLKMVTSTKPTKKK
ncbi:hypothetical protein FQN57_001982 [Myotisia sp. PD_48]|nr:hypothetical protein FQN57_001982 [Myotisia sp. PD_48]